jgi:hypothetical protein
MSDKPSFFERMRGKRTRDIELPNESGTVDGRLPDYVAAGQLFRKGLDVLKDKKMGPYRERVMKGLDK